MQTCPLQTIPCFARIHSLFFKYLENMNISYRLPNVALINLKRIYFFFYVFYVIKCDLLLRSRQMEINILASLY